MSLIDSHCHLDDSQFDTDRDDVVRRAVEAGVEHMVAIGTGDGPPDLEAGLRILEQFPMMWATIGVHPHNAAAADDSTFARLRELALDEKVIAVGEIGLDYHYDFSPRDLQREVFTEQLRIAREHSLPITIHTREAWDDTFEILGKHWSGPGVMHCFTGGPEEARRCLDLGFTLSFSGIVTYPKALEIQEAAKLAPPDRLLVETDAPYLAPVPRRGKRNEPAFVVETARRLAELRGELFEDLCRLTSENFYRLFARARQ